MCDYYENYHVELISIKNIFLVSKLDCMVFFVFCFFFQFPTYFRKRSISFTKFSFDNVILNEVKMSIMYKKFMTIELKMAPNIELS